VSSDKKICIATGIFPPDTGGPAKFADSFALWSKTNNKALSIVTLTDSEDRREVINGAEVELISRSHRFLRRFFRTSYVLRKKMKAGEIVLANGLFLETYIASLLLRKVEYVTKVPGDIVWERARNNGYTNQSIDAFQNQRLNLKWRIFRTLFTQSLKKSKLVIAPSKHLASLCRIWGISDKRIALINNSIDTEEFCSASVDKKWDVITVCRLVPWKGVQELIEDCAKLSLSLCVVGDGPQREHLESLSKFLGLKYEFKGNLSESEVRISLDKARCFVLNSSFEATSYALLEARSMGLFSIARRNTGSEEIIQHDLDGILCDDNYPLLNALKRFDSDKDFVASATNAARADTETRFGSKDNFEKIYSTVMG